MLNPPRSDPKKTDPSLKVGTKKPLPMKGETHVGDVAKDPKDSELPMPSPEILSTQQPSTTHKTKWRIDVRPQVRLLPRPHCPQQRPPRLSHCLVHLRRNLVIVLTFPSKTLSEKPLPGERTVLDLRLNFTSMAPIFSIRLKAETTGTSLLWCIVNGPPLKVTLKFPLVVRQVVSETG